MFCTRCGADNAEDAKFCRNCAATLAKPGAGSSGQQLAGPPPPVAAPPSNQPYPGYQGYQSYPQAQQPYSSGAPQAQQGNASGRATASLVLGILSVVSSLAGCCCFPVSLIGLPLGIIGVVLGKQELNAIRAGAAPQAGEQFARGGFYTGIAGAILSALAAALTFLGVLGNLLAQFGSGRF